MIYLLILTHNRLPEVRRCFESLAQTLARSDVRCVVHDNKSEDGTREWVFNELGITSKATVILCESNLGVALGRSELLNDAKHFGLNAEDLVVFLDSDAVIIDDNWLDVLTKAIEPENVGLVGPGGSYVLPDWSGFAAGVPGEVDCVAGYCQMFKGEIIKSGISVDTSYHYFWTEDSQFCMDIRNAGYDILCVPVGIHHAPSHSGYGQHQHLHNAHIAMFRERWQGKGLIKSEGGY